MAKIKWKNKSDTEREIKEKETVQEKYEKLPDKMNTDKVLSALRKVFTGKISFYENGKVAFAQE